MPGRNRSLSHRPEFQALALAGLPLLLLLSLCLPAQEALEGEIRGRVWNAPGEPLPNALLALQAQDSGGLYEIQAGADGRFRRRLPLGRYELSIRGEGAESWKISVRLTRIRPRLRVELDLEKLRQASRDYDRFTRGLHEQSSASRVRREREAFLRARQNRGVRLLRNGEAEEALAAFDEVLAEDPGRASVAALRTSALAAAGRSGEAIAAYQELLAAEPHEASHHNNLGISLVRAGRLEEGLTHFRTAAKSDKRRSGVYEFNLGSALLNAGRVQEASRHFRNSIKRDPTRAVAHYFYGVSIYRQGPQGKDRRRAISSLRRYLQFEPDGEYANSAREYLDQLNRGASGLLLPESPAREDLE